MHCSDRHFKYNNCKAFKYHFIYFLTLKAPLTAMTGHFLENCIKDYEITQKMTNLNKNNIKKAIHAEFVI